MFDKRLGRMDKYARDCGPEKRGLFECYQLRNSSEARSGSLEGKLQLNVAITRYI
jgi:hypothetical protein